MAVAEATTFVVHDPATGEEIARVADADRSAIEAAIAAAHAAFPSWSALPSESRAELLHRAHHLLVERTEPIARLLTRENGKPLSESRAEVSMSARFLLWHAEEAKRTYGRVVPPSVKDRRILVLRQPVGVVAAITPWNFPLSMVARKVAPAIAAGCTVILRPAKKTPLVAIELFDIFAAAGFPPGVANLVTSRDAALFAEMALADRRVRKITFTGSTEVGKSLLAGASSQVKRVSLELGGHAPFIVFEDADLDAAAAAAVLSRFRNAGQTCVCTNRLLVQRSIVREFTERVASRVAALRVGNGLDDGTDVGPLTIAPPLPRSKRIKAMPLRAGRASSLAVSASRPCPAVFSTSRRYLIASGPMRSSRARRRSDRSCRSSNSPMSPRRCASRTTRRMVSLRTSTPATSRGCSAAPRASNTASSA